MNKLYRDDFLSSEITVLGFSELLILIAHGCGIVNMFYPLRFLLSVSVFMFFIMTGYELKPHKQISGYLRQLRGDTLHILLPFAVIMILIRSDLVFHDTQIYLLWLLLAFYAVRAVYSVVNVFFLILHGKKSVLFTGVIMLVLGLTGAFSGFFLNYVPFKADALLVSFFPVSVGLFLRYFYKKNTHKALFIGISAVLFVISIITDLFADPVHQQYPLIIVGLLLSAGSALFLLWISGYAVKLPVLQDICHTLAGHPVLVLCMARLDLYVMQTWTSQYAFVRILLRTITDLSWVLIISLLINAIRPSRITKTDYILCQKYQKAFNIYFYIAFACLMVRATLLQTMIGSSIGGTILNTWLYQPTAWIAYSLILVFTITLSSIQKRLWIFLEIGIFAAVTIWYHEDPVYHIYVLFLIMLAATGKDFKKMMKIYFITVLTLLIIAWWTSLHGYVINLVYYRDRVHRTSPRYALGANYVTDLASHWFYLIALTCIAIPKKRNWKLFIIYPVLFYIAYYIYHVTNARLDMIATFALIFITLLAHLRCYLNTGSIYRRITSVVSYICSFSYLFFTALSFYMVANYNMKTTDMPFQSILGKIMDLQNFKSRLMLSKSALSQYSLKIFGNAADYTEIGEGGRFSMPSKITFLDISYIKIPFMYGLLIAAILLSVWTFTILNQARQHHTFWVLVLTIVAFTGFVEHHLAEYYYNIFTLAAFTPAFLSAAQRKEVFGHENK